MDSVRLLGEVLAPLCRSLLPLLLLLLLLPVTASAELAIPQPPSRRVNDYASALSAGDRERLERKLIEGERTSSNQVVVAVFRSLRGENLEDYSIRLAQAWRIGQKGLDNGVIFLIFLDDRKMRLEVGYGLEATLTDAIAGSIIRDVVAPRFREGRYADGIDGGLDAISAAIAGTYVRPVPSAQPARRSGGLWPPSAPVVVMVIFIFVFGAMPVLALLLGATPRGRRSRRHGWTGGGGGWSTWSSSGGSSWSSGSSSSSDSFSGGGGSFGGGGASGSW